MSRRKQLVVVFVVVALLCGAARLVFVLETYATPSHSRLFRSGMIVTHQQHTIVT